MLKALFFSPTGSSKKIADCVLPDVFVDWTPGRDRREITPGFLPGDVLFFAFPVYRGRVPRMLLGPLGRLMGNGAKAILCAVYGNRNYDDALIEAFDILSARGFTVIGACAVVGEHSWCDRAGAYEPSFSARDGVKAYVRERIEKGKALSSVPGSRPYRPYFRDLQDGEKPPMLDAPYTNQRCSRCGMCVRRCPVGAIDRDCVTIGPNCIHCMACVKKCVLHAKENRDERIRAFADRLAADCAKTKDPVFVREA